MKSKALLGKIRAYDERRDLVVPGDLNQTIRFAVDYFVTIAKESIEEHGVFNVALSGGSSPKAVYEGLVDSKIELDWKKVHLFWSDERCVPPYHPDSNYRMAMEASFSKLHIPAENIHRMQAEGDCEEGATLYEKLILTKLPEKSFDLVLLGMGEDGHTASLFPETHGLHAEARHVTANYIPKLDTWRLTLTFECINKSKNIALYVTGKNKASMVKQVLEGPYEPDEIPAQRIGTSTNKALWILDKEASKDLANLPPVFA